MDKHDAVTLQNFWPGTNNVVLRKGYDDHVTGITGQVETLMNYSSGTAEILFGAAGTSVYNVTSAGAVGAAVLTGMTNARWQYVNFTVSGTASYLCMVNGADEYQVFDGAAWHDDGDGPPYDITGVTSTTLSNITVFKNRIWFTQNSTLKAWYLPIDAIGGAATALDMSSNCKKGGYLMAAMTWTLDAGYGVDDYLTFITSEGEVLVWRLTDPTTPTGIALIGVWQIGAPVGRRCWLKYGGDLLLITNDGVVPMSKALQSSQTDPRISITDKIQSAMSSAIRSYGSNFGWQLLLFPRENQLYLNVPVSAGDNQQQFVMNTITKSWCNFTDWEANCWELFNDEPYFGSNGVVYKAWTGTTDNGAAIQGLALQSFQAYGGARQKQCKMIRYHLASDGVPQIYGDVNVDYDLSDRAAELIGTPLASGGIWDTSLWDSAMWAGGLAPSAEWQGATGIGYTFAPFLKTSSSGIQLQWTATDMIFEAGGTL
jgi:hypothetical protein